MSGITSDIPLSFPWTFSPGVATTVTSVASCCRSARRLSVHYAAQCEYQITSANSFVILDIRAFCQIVMFAVFVLVFSLLLSRCYSAVKNKV